MRTFIALSLPTEVADSLGDIAAKMAYQDKSNAVRWANQDNYHVTLAFLGDQEVSAIDQLVDELEYEISSFGIESRVIGLSPFPETKPKLIAALLQNSTSLVEIQHQVVKALNNAAIKYEKRRFIPHITLGRLRHTRNPYSGTIPLAFDLPIDFAELVLFESHLRTNGAEYDAVFRYPIQYDDYSMHEDSLVNED